MKQLLGEISNFCYENDIEFTTHLLAGMHVNNSYDNILHDLSNINTDEIQRVFNKVDLRYPYIDISTAVDLHDWIIENELYGFFVELNFRVYENHVFDKDGDPKSCVSTNTFHVEFTYADNLESLFKTIKIRSIYYTDLDCEVAKKKSVKQQKESAVR